MTYQEQITKSDGASAEVFACLTAEAWLDPELAAKIKADKFAAVAFFITENGFLMPDESKIENYELPPNPVGELEMSVAKITMGTTTDGTSSCDYGCSTAAPGCGSNNGTCGDPSAGCPSDGCSAQCWTAVQCSIDCYTTQCTQWFCGS